MNNGKRSVARRITRTGTPWLWEGAGYFLAMAIVGTELITRIAIFR
jgi:hypothetical protein